MNLQRIRIALIIIGLLLIAVALVFTFDFSGFSWRGNSSSYLVMIAGVCIAGSGLGSYLYSDHHSADGH